MSSLKMSGRIYNAMIKFAGGTKSAPQLAHMFFHNGKVYATNSFVMCRWTPAEKYEVLDNKTGKKIESFYFWPRMDKVAAGTTIYIDDIGLDIDCKANMVQDPDKIIDGAYKHSLDVVMGVNPDYLSSIAALGKAVRADKCGVNGIVDLDWSQNILHAHIDAGNNGFFDVIVMPVLDKKKVGKK